MIGAFQSTNQGLKKKLIKILVRPALTKIHCNHPPSCPHRRDPQWKSFTITTPHSSPTGTPVLALHGWALGNPTFSAAFLLHHSTTLAHIPGAPLAPLSSSPRESTEPKHLKSFQTTTQRYQHPAPKRLAILTMLPPSYSDHDPTPPPSFDSLALLFSHYPIITQFAKLITTGDCTPPLISSS